MSESPRRRRAAVAMIIAGSTLATTALALVPGAASASSHREAPLISSMPAVDNTDVYSFVSPDKPDTVTLIANWFPFSEPVGGPNFYPWAENARYDINIDADGDAVADTTYRWEFRTDDRRVEAETFLYNVGPIESLDDPDLLFRQYYTLTKIQGDHETVLLEDAQVAPSNTGPASVPDYGVLRDEATYDLYEDRGQTFTGQAEDPFFLDLRVFDLLYGGDLSEIGQDTLAGYNVNTIAIQVPISEVALNGDPRTNPVIGVWSDTEMRSLELQPTGGAEPVGDYVQVSRLGNPLVNELVLPVGLKDAFNAITPDVDATIPAVVERVTDPELARLIDDIYGIPAPATPRNDLVEIFLTGIATNAPTLDGSVAPIQADLNSQVLNGDVDPANFVPSEMQRLNTAVPVTEEPSRLGVLGNDLQGFPNGRRLADDVVDIEIQAVEGAVANGLPVELVEALAAGDAVDSNDKGFGDTFPYVALPNDKSVNDPANTQADIPEGAAVAPFGGPGNGPVLPTPSLVTGIAAVALLGSGFFMIARRRETVAPVTA
ncbi:MAG: FIG01133373: hypothetical protein [uncultured Pseudonocardia sp.]|uniref:DUF4331 domain-containing protein n=1 Tax=uncultured Pseudonocardia sp. TaxID=211455 RepID=A0A6J4QT68_9PSEU|nr:MAG: FIG01133373: hypothetical protein [uncultured Pseudonocardia sp.]